MAASLTSGRSSYSGMWRGGQRGKGRFTLQVDVGNALRELEASLGQIGADLRDFSPAWRAIAPLLAASSAQAFATEGASLGYRWDPLSPDYLNRRRNDGLGSQPLRRTGRLYSRVTSSSRGVLLLNARRMSFGVRAPGARAMQFGFRPQPGTGTGPHARRGGEWTGAGATRRKVGARLIRGNVARRPFLRWSDELEAQVQATVAEYLAAVVDNAVGGSRRQGLRGAA